MPAPVDPLLLAATLDDRRDPEVIGGLLGQGVAAAVGPEPGQEARGQLGARPGKAPEEEVIRMGLEELVDALIIVLDGPVQGADLGHQSPHPQQGRLHDGGIGAQRPAGGDLFESLLDERFATGVMRIGELANRFGSGGGDRFEAGPPQQEGAAQRAIKTLPDQAQGLGEVLFEAGPQAVAKAGAQVDRLAAILPQAAEQPGRLGIRMPDFQDLRMPFEQIEQEARIDRIVFGSTGMEGLAILGQRERIDRIQIHVPIPHERVDHRPPTLLQAHRDPPLGILGLQGADPFMDGLGALRQNPRVHFSGGGFPPLQVMLLIRPVQSHQDGILFFHRRFLQLVVFSGTTRWL